MRDYSRKALLIKVGRVTLAQAQVNDLQVVAFSDLVDQLGLPTTWATCQHGNEFGLDVGRDHAISLAEFDFHFYSLIG